MSGTSRSWLDPDVDRRVRRTRQGVVHAFAQLAVERPYDAFTVNDLLARADVGRSTFYAHYRGKDDVLLQAMTVMYELLADALCTGRDGAEEPDRLAALLEHFRENALLLRRLSTGSAAEPFERSKDAFARLIETRLVERCVARGVELVLPTAQVAAALAHGELALVLRWVGGRDGPPRPAVDVARAMRSLFRAGVASLTRTEGESESRTLARFP